MAGKKRQTTKSKIVKAAWKLFYKQGYENTTVDEIIELSKTSKGSFYHYFKGKDALLSSLSYLLDQKYEEVSAELDPDMDAYDKLMRLNLELFRMIETSVDIELLAMMYSSQLVTKDERHLLDENRFYFRLVRQIILEGQEKGELIKEKDANEIANVYTLMERALLYDWCLYKGRYSLPDYGQELMGNMMKNYRV